MNEVHQQQSDAGRDGVGRGHRRPWGRVLISPGLFAFETCTDRVDQETAKNPGEIKTRPPMPWGLFAWIHCRLNSRQLSQQDLARMSGIHLGQISRYERGVILPSAETAVLLCRALRVSADALLFGDQAKEEPLEIENLRLLERFRRLSEMDRDRQETAIKLIDALVAQRDVEMIVARAGSSR